MNFKDYIFDNSNVIIKNVNSGIKIIYFKINEKNDNYIITNKNSSKGNNSSGGKNSTQTNENNPNNNNSKNNIL